MNVYLEALSVPALDCRKVRMPLKNPRGFTVFLWARVNHLIIWFSSYSFVLHCMAELTQQKREPITKPITNRLKLKMAPSYKGKSVVLRQPAGRKRWEMIPVGAFKWITLVGDIKCTACRWMGNTLSYWLFCRTNEEFLSLFGGGNKCTYKDIGKRRSEMASSEPATLHLYTLFNRWHKWAALHSRALQCKQLGLHSTSHLLAVAPTHIFINSCVYQNLAAYIAIFSS